MDLAVFCVQTDDDVTGKLRTQVADEAGVVDRFGSDDDVLHTGLKIGLHRLFVANATTHLDRQFREGLGNGVNHVAIHRFAFEGTIEIDQMQPACAGFDPSSGHCNRIVGKNGRIFHSPLTQAHALAVFKVNGRYQQHR